MIFVFYMSYRTHSEL